MALISIKFYSSVLQSESEILVCIPEAPPEKRADMPNIGADGKYKSVLLLHGICDDKSLWIRRTNVERYADALGVAIIMADGGRSFYTDMKYGNKMLKYIAEEVPAAARKFLPISDKKEDSFVAGFSMGGYGALKTFFRYRDRYMSAAALSPVCDIVKHVGENTWNFSAIFGEPPVVPQEEDLYYLAANAGDSAKIYMAIGQSDFLYNEAAAYSDYLLSHGADVTYEEAPGGHSWDFWNVYIERALRFFFPEK